MSEPDYEGHNDKLDGTWMLMKVKVQDENNVKLIVFDGNYDVDENVVRALYYKCEVGNTGVSEETMHFFAYAPLRPKEN